MRYLKGLLIAAIAAAVLMAFAGAALAASELYKGGTTLSAGSTIHASLASGASSLLEIEESESIVGTCTGSTVESKTTSTAGEQIQAEITSLIWSGCTSTTDTLTNGTLRISRIPGTDNGTLSASGLLWTVALGGTTCRYGTGESTDLGTITGETSTAKHARVDINALINEQAPKQTLCPDTTNWTATWTITTPTGLNVGEETVPPQVTELYKGGTTLSAGSTIDATLASGASFGLSTTDGTNIVGTCTGTELQAKTTSTSGVSAEITSLAWSGCTSTIDTLTNGNVGISHIPGTDNGTFVSSGAVWTLMLGGTSCRYGTANGTHLGTITGRTSTNDHATADISAVINEQEPKAFLCPDTTKASATLTVTTPTGHNVGGESQLPLTELYKGAETLGKGTALGLSLQSGSTAVLSTTDGSSIVDTCSGSTLEASTAAAEGAPLTASITALTWGPTCSVTTHTLTNGSLSITHIPGTDNGTLSASGTTWTVNLGVSCRYGFGGGTHLGTITGETSTAKHARIDINAVIKEQEPKQFMCPDTTRWVANYTITSPTVLNVRSS